MPSRSDTDNSNIAYWYGYSYAAIQNNYDQTLQWNGAVWSQATNYYYIHSTSAASAWIAGISFWVPLDVTDKGYTSVKMVSTGDPSMLISSLVGLTGIQNIGATTSLTKSGSTYYEHGGNIYALWCE